MKLDEGKQERKYHTFLGIEYRIDMIPCGISIPFNVEMNKIRERSLEITYKIDPKTKSSKVFTVLNKYLDEHPDEAQEQMNLMVRAISVITEFYTDGKVNEKYISAEASDDDIGKFMFEIQKVLQRKTLKKLQEVGKSLQ